MTAPHAFDARAILAEFPAGACQSNGTTFRAFDGFGNVGTGPSWEQAAANLRARRHERAAIAAELDAEAQTHREAVARFIGHAILWGALVVALVAGVLETVRP